MPTSAPGSDAGGLPSAGLSRPLPASLNRPLPARLAGFTLIELMVVVAIIAIATTGVTLALRDAGTARLDREAQRLAALFESARAQSRASGVPLRWRPLEDGFVFERGGSTTVTPGAALAGSPAPASTGAGQPGAVRSSLGTGGSELPRHWLGEGVRARIAAPIVLGPEPVLPPQVVELQLLDAQGNPSASRRLASDGLRPFAVAP